MALLSGLTLHTTSALDAVERHSVDQRFALRGPHAPHPDIVIVALDQRSLRAINQRPPIPRRLYAQLLDRLAAAGVRLAALDVQFVGTTTAVDDQALVTAIQRHAPVVLATHDGPDGPLPVPAGQEVEGAVPASVGVAVDPDVVVRRQIYAPVDLLALPVRVAELLKGQPVAESDFPGNHAWIDFAGPPDTYPQVSFVDVLDGAVGARELAGKVALVGVTDPAGGDVFVTSAATVPMSGVELHANSLGTILDGLPLREAPGALVVLLLLLLSGVPALAAGRLAALPLIGLGVGAVVLYLIAAQLAFVLGVLVPLAAPVVALVLATAGAAAVDSLSERRRRAELEATLADLPTELDPAFFISYRRDQTSWPAQALKDGLEERFGRDTVFLDLGSIHAGQDWQARIRAAVTSCSTVLVLIGHDWLEARDAQGHRRLESPDDWVRREIEEGLASPAVTVVPVLLDGAPMPRAEELPASLAELPRRNAYGLSAAQWSAQLDDLVESLRTSRLGEARRRPRSTSA